MYGSFIHSKTFVSLFLLHQSLLQTIEIDDTVRPRGTRPRGTQTSLGHDFKKGSKILAGHDFGT